jgi:hypothetical protein
MMNEHRVTASPRQPNGRAIRQVTRKTGTVETVVSRPSSVIDDGDRSSGTRHHPCASPRGIRTQSPDPATTAAPARAPAKRRPVARVKNTAVARVPHSCVPHALRWARVSVRCSRFGAALEQAKTCDHFASRILGPIPRRSMKYSWPAPPSGSARSPTWRLSVSTPFSDQLRHS